MCKPVILLCGFNKDSILQMPSTYTNAIVHSGGIPFAVSPTKSLVKDYIKRVNGLLLIGGGDVKASIYGGSEKYDKDVDYERDIFELNAVNYAVERKIPILGICRGCQVINIALGGNLYENTEHHYNTEHQINIEENSILSKCLKSESYIVNSYHHQACMDLGRGLKPTAFCDDGYTEAFECVDFYCHGLQFHPEKMTKDTLCQNIFEDFINACNQTKLFFL